MAAPSLNESEVRLLRALSRRKVRFMVVGLSAAAMQRAPVVTQDVGLWFEDLNDPRIREALREVGAAYVPPSVLNPPMLAGEGVELFDIVLTLHGLESFAEEWANTLPVPLGRYKFHVLALERILASKRAANRPKDQLIIPVLEHSLAVKKAAAKREGKRTPTGRRRSP